MDAWQEALFDMYYPPVPEPEISLEKNYNEAFYIDVRNWTVHLNLYHAPSLEPESLARFTRAISQHELGHYSICPYDGVTNALMLQGAASVVGEVHAPIVTNIFSDLVVEKHLSRRFSELNAWYNHALLEKVAAELKGQQPTPSWKIMTLAESILCDQELPPSVDKIVRNDPNIVDVAKKLANLVKTVVDDQGAWPRVVKKVARLLRPYLASDFPEIEGNGPCDVQSGERIVPGTGGTRVRVPSEVLETFGDVTKPSDRDTGRLGENALKDESRRAAGRDGRGGKKGKKDKKDKEDKGDGNADHAADDTLDDDDGNREKILEELAKNAGGISEFGGPARMLGLVRDENILLSYYRYRSKGLIDVQVKVPGKSGLLPVSPATWRLGDPVESLDLTLTLLNSPVIIPNMTTRRWDFRESIGLNDAEVLPDFLIVIDSSFSMRWNPEARTESGRGQYDVALVAAFAAVHFARGKGVRVAAINFSGSHVACEWTRDLEEVEEVLVMYEGDGTVLPTDAIVDMARRNGGPTLVFIISDAGLYDWYGSIPPLLDLVRDGHHVVMFLIGGRQSNLKKKRFVEFMEMGGKIHVIPSIKALTGLVVKEIQDTYALDQEGNGNATQENR